MARYKAKAFFQVGSKTYSPGDVVTADHARAAGEVLVEKIYDDSKPESKTGSKSTAHRAIKKSGQDG